MRQRESVQELIEDESTAPELATRLRLMAEARDFSIEMLDLPDNKSYRSYADLQRDYALWNVYAAPEFSLSAKQWCFPVAGCVSYRGYFSKDAALKASEGLANRGFDVAVGGVVAYSTLGRFSDPILSTMMRWSDVDIVAVLFHELAHQVLYVKDDSAFNESFATAVEEIGVRRWLESRGEEQKVLDYIAARALRQSVMSLVAIARDELDTIYTSNTAVQGKRLHKRERLDVLADQVGAEYKRHGRVAPAWQRGELNNAKLISLVLYEGRLPAFRALYKKCEMQLSCFYAEAKKLAEMDFAARDVALSAGDLLRFGQRLNEQ